MVIEVTIHKTKGRGDNDPIHLVDRRELTELPGSLHEIFSVDALKRKDLRTVTLSFGEHGHETWTYRRLEAS